MTLYELLNKLHYDKYYDKMISGVSGIYETNIIDDFILFEPLSMNCLHQAKTFDPSYLHLVSFPTRDLKEIDPITKIPLLYKKYKVLHHKIVGAEGLKNTVYKYEIWDYNDYAANEEATALILIL